MALLLTENRNTLASDKKKHNISHTIKTKNTIYDLRNLGIWKTLKYSEIEKVLILLFSLEKVKF